MENFVKILKNNQLNAQVINQDQSQQGLQFLLNCNESIIVKKEALSYLSSGLHENYVHEKSLLDELIEKSNNNNENKISDAESTEDFKESKIPSTSEINYKDYLKFSNRTNEIKYLAVSTIGKILTISPILYDSLVVDIKYVVAFDNKIGLHKYVSDINKLLFNGIKFNDFVQVGLKGGNDRESLLFGSSVISDTSFNSKLYLQSNGKSSLF